MEKKNILTATDGKIWMQKNIGEILGKVVCIGKYDSAKNYEEIDIPKPKENED